MPGRRAAWAALSLHRPSHSPGQGHRSPGPGARPRPRGASRMSSPEKSDLSSRLGAVVEEARGRVKAFQTEAEATRQEVRRRFETFLPIAERIVAMAREK